MRPSTSFFQNGVHTQNKRQTQFVNTQSQSIEKTRGVSIARNFQPFSNGALGNHKTSQNTFAPNKIFNLGSTAKFATIRDESIRLIDASFKGDLEKVKNCISAGAEVNTGDYDSRTALHLAAAEGQVAIVEYLLELGANPNALDRFGNTPLHDAKRKRTPDHTIVGKLLEKHGGVLTEIRFTPEFQSSIQKALPLLCERGNWEYAEAWVPSSDETKLISSELWYSDRSKANKYTSMRQGLERVANIAPENGLYSKVWKSKQAAWVESTSTEKLTHLSPSDIGLKSGIVIPILYEGKVLAVLGFYSTDPRPVDNSMIESFSDYSSGLIKAGLSRTVDKSIGSREQMNVVYQYILEEGVFNGTLIYQELDWFYNHLGLQQYYFERFSPSTIAKHLHSFIAAKKLAQTTGQPEDVRVSMQQKDSSSAFYLVPADHESLVHVESRVEQMIYAMPPDKAYTLTFFRSKGTAIPNGTMHVGLYIFDTCDYIEKSPDVNETSVWKLATGVFLRDKTPMIRERYQDLLKRTAGKLSPVMEVFPEYRDGTIPLMVAFKLGSNASYMSQITELIKHNGLVVERKFIETFANGLVVYSLYLHHCEKPVLNGLLDQLSLLHAVPRSPLTEFFVHSKCSAEEYAYASAASRCIYYFLSKPSEEFNMLAKVFKDDPLNMGRLALLQTTLRRDAISQERITKTLMEYPEIWKRLFDDFNKIITVPTKPEPNLALSEFIKKEVVDELDEAILLGFYSFNNAILKTNFYKRKKSGLAFRLDPTFMADAGYPTVPYAIFFILSSEFQGFHVRFRDVARGGIRIIASSNEESYTRNVETQFDETYNLAYTQNKKNKDIPEFGSKGTILLNYHPSAQKNKFLAFQKYISGLLDLVIPIEKQSQDNTYTPVDHYGKPELLFLGPDEYTADFMQWAAEYAGRRRYDFPLALTTGKPMSMGGVPHDKFGMTTRSVHTYVVGCLDKSGLKEEEVTKLQTGGPDGDLGSNEILMSKDKTIGVVDGSGVVYDPAGLNREELTRLAHKRAMVIEFDQTKLGPGGFKVLVTDRDVTLPNGEVVASGFVFRNEFHLNPLVTADLFVPCGGRPESVNLKNVQRMFNKDGTPRFKFVIEGANLFLTPDARMVLEQNGVVVYKDASTNKGGVTSSSLEVLAALAMSKEEHELHMQVEDPENPPAFYTQYVEEITKRIEDNAAQEFECIWKEHEQTKIPRYILTDKLSDKINSFNDAVQSSTLWSNEKLKHSVMKKALPQTLVNLLGLEALLKKIPENYAQAIFGSYIASRYVYKYGLSAPEFAFFEFVHQFMD